MTKCLEHTDCLDVAVEICRHPHAPNLESEHGYLVSDALFDGQQMQFLE